MVLKRLLLISVAGCSMTPGPTDGGACQYDTFEGTCVLTDLWIGETDGDRVAVEAQYETPRGTETVRHHVAARDGERMRLHLTRHARVPCRGRVITRGSCEPSSLTLELPDL